MENKPGAKSSFRARASSVASGVGDRFGSFRSRTKSVYSVSVDQSNSPRLDRRGEPISFRSHSLDLPPPPVLSAADLENMPIDLRHARKRTPEPTKKLGKIVLISRHRDDVSPAGAVFCDDRHKPTPRNVVDRVEKAWFTLCSSQYVGEMAKMLEEEDIQIDRRDYFTGFTALHWACKCGNTDMMQLCLHHKANVNIKTHGGYSALHLASKHNHPSMCTALLNAGANTNLRDNIGKLPYHVAHKKLPQAVKERLLKGVNSNVSKALTLMNIQMTVKKSTVISGNLRLGVAGSKGKIYDDEEGAMMPRSGRNWFKKKSSHYAPTSSSVPTPSALSVT